MAFGTNNSSTNKNQFVASLNSRKSDKATCWVNLTDSFVLSVFPNAKSIRDVTAEEVVSKLTKYYSNDYVYLHVVDTTAERTTITPEEF